jgi:hypothetical protein
MKREEIFRYSDLYIESRLIREIRLIFDHSKSNIFKKSICGFRNSFWNFSRNPF